VSGAVGARRVQLEWVETGVSMLAAVATVTGMIATPLAPQRGLARRVLSTVVVTGLFASTTMAAARRWGVGRAGLAAGTTVAATAAIERIGTDTGLPFGRYRYTGALRPEVAGVPAIVPLAWFAMAVPARETAHAALGRHSSRVTRAIAGSAALTAWDLFLDPQMVGEGYWRWNRTGVYRSIPMSNYLGWFVTGIGIIALLDILLPAADEPAKADGALVGQYAYMGVMETLGFARFFHDRLVAAVGGSTMLPIAAAAIAGKLRG
jgi:uncharacterized membrane protein